MMWMVGLNNVGDLIDIGNIMRWVSWNGIENLESKSLNFPLLFFSIGVKPINSFEYEGDIKGGLIHLIIDCLH